MNKTPYDNNDFFELYNSRRRRSNSPNEAIEKPIINKLIGDVKGKQILDLGCGDGLFGKELLDRGAKSYHGIDSSANMINLAKKNLADGQFQQATLEGFNLSPNKYGLICSRLVFHYVANLHPVFQEISNGLKANGVFVFSVEHPVMTSCYDAYHQTNGKRSNWIVDNYFDSGKRINNWLGEAVVKYHRTLEDYWQLFKGAGLKVLEIRESKPQEANFKDKQEYERRKRIPLFLIFKLEKT